MSIGGAMRARGNRFVLFFLRRIVPLVAFLAVSVPASAQTQSGIPVENRAFLKFTNYDGGTDTLAAAVTMRVTKTSNILLRKTVNFPSGSKNDTLIYTLKWKNTGVGPAASFVIDDSVHAGLTYLPNSTVSNKPVITSLDSRTLRFNVADVAAGDSGFVKFRAVINVPQGEISNWAHATYISENEFRDSFSDTVNTHIEPWQMQLTLVTLNDRVLHVGDTLEFRISVINPSHTLELHNVLVTDTIPEELSYIESSPEALDFGTDAAIRARIAAATRALLISLQNPAVGSGGAATWHFDIIAPGETRDILVRTLVTSVGDGHITNTATANGAGVSRALAAVAAAVVDKKFGLAITKTASALEVGTGEAVGFTITVRNTGNTPSSDIVVHDLPAAGVRVQHNSLRGAKFGDPNGEMLFDVGSIDAGKQVTIQYVATVIGERGAVLANRAFALAETGVETDTVGVTIRVRDAAMLSRVVMGKVWLDENGDGRQQASERALANAVVWSSHGETVRSDSLGRFTFPDLNTGRYTFRVDPLSVPAGFDNAQPVSTRVDGWSTPVVGFAVPRGKKQMIAGAPAGRMLGFGSGTVNLNRPRISAPADSSIVGTNKIFVRYEGIPGDSVQLYDNAKPIGKASLRTDGSADFLGIDVTPGPHKISGVMMGSGDNQTASIDIHVSGSPKTVIRNDTAVLRAGRTQVIALRVLDGWKMPVAQKPYATVGVRGMHLVDSDIDPSSVGMQLPVGTDGTLLVRVIGDSAGVAHMNVAFGGHDETSIDLIMLPEIRSLVVLADGEIGAGATSRSYGAATARGAIDDKTSVTLSYDSRRTRSQAFGGAFDPLGESRMPITGDGSERTVLGSATSPLSLKVERDRGWLLLGDVDTRGFGSDNSPAAYRRTLPGMSGHMLSGPLDVFGFGSMVAQQIVQKQIRGDGTSGPYNIGGEVRLGTDHIVIETRDRLNASLVISRQELERFVDYDIDATTGSILLRRPLASSDASGNPMMLVALAEQIHGASAFVGGLHAQVAGSPFKSGRDTIRIGGGYIEDQSPLGGHTLISGELGANTRFGGSRMEIAHGANRDSAGIALHASAWLGSLTGTGAMFQWNRVGDGFANPANPRLVSGTQDMRLSGQTALGSGWTVGGAYGRQSFRSRGADRAQSTLTLARTLGDNKLSLDVGMMDERQSLDTIHGEYRSLTSRLSYAQKRSTKWLEASQPLHTDGIARPATYGVGMSYDMGHGIRAEASERLVKTDSTLQGLSTVALRSEFSTGTRAWTEYQLGNSINGSTSAAVVGIGQKLRVSSAWSVDAQYERRAGLNKLPETDPSRALPFAQQEKNHWAASLGTEWTPSGMPARGSLRAELHNGDDTGRGYRIFGSGEAAINSSLSLLVREDTREDRRILNTGLTTQRAAQTILAAAFRPAARSDWNSLIKLEWRNDENPQRNGGALLAGTNRRVIGATETVWTPSTQTELGFRFALRHSDLGGLLAENNVITSNTQYVGARLRQQLTSRIDARMNGRLLMEHAAGISRWDLAPAAGIKLVQGLDLEAGYRFGDLTDADFAQNGGHGLYATLGMSITEKTGQSIAEFWRNRVGGGR